MANHTMRVAPGSKARTTSNPVETARGALGRIEAGCTIMGFTKGQFSLLDLIRAVLAQTGPADVVVSTWTTGIRDAENAQALIRKGEIRSLRLLTDRSFPSRQPKYVAKVREVFGDDAIRVTRTHCKFALVRNEAWDVAIPSSMNLNRNPRFEQFVVFESREVCDFVQAHVDEMTEAMPTGLRVATREVDRVFAGAMGGGLSDVYSLAGGDNEGEILDMDALLGGLLD